MRTFRNFRNKCPMELLLESSGILKMNIYKNLFMNIRECLLVNVHEYPVILLTEFSGIFKMNICKDL